MKTKRSTTLTVDAKARKLTIVESSEPKPKGTAVKPPATPSNEPIEIDGGVIASAKHDILSNGVKLAVAAPFDQFPESVCLQLSDLVENEQLVDVTLKPERGQDIEFKSCSVFGVKHDIVSRVVKVTLGINFQQLTVEIRELFQSASATRRAIRMTLLPQQQSLNFNPPAGRQD